MPRYWLGRTSQKRPFFVKWYIKRYIKLKLVVWEELDQHVVSTATKQWTLVLKHVLRQNVCPQSALIVPN